MSRWRMHRRKFVLGACNTAIALPLLEAMFDSDRALASAQARPLRFTFTFFPNGAVGYEMSPTSLDALSGVLEPFIPHRAELVSVNGLNNRDNNTWDRNNVDLGSGTPHEINAPTFLTCQRLGSLEDLLLSPSIDQLIGAHLQAVHETRLPSIAVGDGDTRSGIGQGGVNRAYQHLMSWKSSTQYVVPISRTTELFSEIYAGQTSPDGVPDPAFTAMLARKQSILDSTSAQLDAMRSRVGAADKARIDLYLQTLRDVELKLQAAPIPLACPAATEPPDLDPRAIDEFAAYLDTMADLIVLALQCGVSPVATFQLSAGNDGVRSGVAGVAADQHGVSHYRSGGSEDDLRRINRFYNERAAYLLDRLSRTDDLGQPLLASTVALYGSGIADADHHDGSNCPILLAGGSAYGVRTDRVLDYELRSKAYGEGTPLANLHLGLADLAGLDLETFGNATGPIDLTA